MPFGDFLHLTFFYFPFSFVVQRVVLAPYFSIVLACSSLHVSFKKTRLSDVDFASLLSSHEGTSIPTCSTPPSTPFALLRWTTFNPVCSSALDNL
jgi:hypothetical protein